MVVEKLTLAESLQIGDSQLLELLSGTEPQQLCLVCVHLKPIAGHHSSINSMQETKRYTVVDADAAGALMYNCVSSAYECALCSKTCTGYDSKQLSSVQQEEQRAENGALWHAESQQHDNRQTTSVEDLLSAPVEKRCYPGKCCTTYAK